MKKRIVWLDIAKAFTVFLVLLGHIVTMQSRCFRFIFAFHMPAFIIFSGYLLNIDTTSWKTFVLKKTKTLLFPYLMFSVIGLVITFLLGCEHINYHSILNDITFYLKYIFYYTQPEHAHVGATWFLVGLFWGSIIAYLLLIFLKNRSILQKGFVMLLLFVVASCIIPEIKIPYFIRLPWKIDSGFMFAFFMMIGYYMHQYKILEKTNWISELLCVIIGFGITVYIGVYKNGYVNICDCIFDNQIYYFISSLSGTIAIIGLSKLFSRFDNKLIDFIVNIGSNTLIIFSFQPYAYQQVNYCFNRIFNFNYQTGGIDNVIYASIISLISLLLLEGVAVTYKLIKRKIIHNRVEGG